MIIKKKSAKSIAFALTLLAVPTFVLAHAGATGATKERMDAMAATKDNLSALRAATAADPVDRDRAHAAINALERLADQMPALFEERHLPMVSEALPKIWDQPEQFAKEVRYFSVQLDVARNQIADDPQQVMRTVAAGCASCHEKFREKKNNKRKT